jgi:histidinol-phosphate aminotransferase
LADIEKIQMEIDSIIIQREDLLKVLLDVKFVSKIYPTEANFILIKVDDANRRYDELIAKGIVIRIEQRNLCVKIAYD